MVSRTLNFAASIFLIAGLASQAEGAKPSSKSKTPFTGSALHLAIGATAAAGNMGSEASTLVGRSLYSYGMTASAGIKIFGVIVVGAGYNYGLWRQATEPSQIGNSNLKGTEASWGPMLGLDLGFVALLATSYINSKYAVEKLDNMGRAVNYSAASPGYALQLIFQSGLLCMGIEYRVLQYTKSDVGGVETQLTATTQVKAVSSGVFLGLML